MSLLYSPLYIIKNKDRDFNQFANKQGKERKFTQFAKALSGNQDVDLPI